MDSTTKAVSPPGAMSPNAQALRWPTGWLSASKPSPRSRTFVTRYGESLWTEASILGVRVAPFTCGAQLTRNHSFGDWPRLCHDAAVGMTTMTSPRAQEIFVFMLSAFFARPCGGWYRAGRGSERAMTRLRARASARAL